MGYYIPRAGVKREINLGEDMGQLKIVTGLYMVISQIGLRASKTDASGVSCGIIAGETDI